MRTPWILLALLPSTLTASSLLIAVPDRPLLLAARKGRIEAVARPSLEIAWSVEGLEHPHLAVLDRAGERLAVVDPINDRVAIVDLVDRAVSIREVAGTPIAAAFEGRDLFVLARDGRRLVRLGDDGTMDAVSTAADPALLLDSPGGVLVYARTSGRLELFDPRTLRSLASADAARFASDLESDGRHGYLVLPRDGRIDVFSLETLTTTERRSAGAVPVDLAIQSERTALTASRLAVADPSSKRIWRDEGTQGFGEALGRGFLRGLLGLGLYAARSTEFPTGADRLLEADGRLWAFDSSAGVLYGLRGSNAVRVAGDLEWGAFVIAGGRIHALRDGRIASLSVPIR